MRAEIDLFSIAIMYQHRVGMLIPPMGTFLKIRELTWYPRLGTFCLWKSPFDHIAVQTASL